MLRSNPSVRLYAFHHQKISATSDTVLPSHTCVKDFRINFIAVEGENAVLIVF